MGNGQPLAIRRKKNRLMLVFSMVRLTANNGSFTQYKAKKMGYGINRNPFLCLSNKDPARNTAELATTLGLSCKLYLRPCPTKWGPCWSRRRLRQFTCFLRFLSPHPYLPRAFLPLPLGTVNPCGVVSKRRLRQFTCFLRFG